MTKKERGLIKGALRRVFSRSELRAQAIAKTVVKHSDPSRPKVKTWCKCPVCGKFEAKSYMEADHISPVVRPGEVGCELDANTLVDRLWCAPANLVAKCKQCHRAKSASEMRERMKLRRSKK